MNQYSQEWLEQFIVVIDLLLEVVEFYWMSGDIDYFFKVVVFDIGVFDGVYKKFIEKVDLFDVSLSFVMEWICLMMVFLFYYVLMSE